MHHYSVHIHGKKAEAVAIDLMTKFKSRRPDYTGHPFFHVENHSEFTEFQAKVDGMLPRGHQATIRPIDEEDY